MGEAPGETVLELRCTVACRHVSTAKQTADRFDRALVLAKVESAQTLPKNAESGQIIDKIRGCDWRCDSTCHKKARATVSSKLSCSSRFSVHAKIVTASETVAKKSMQCGGATANAGVYWRGFGEPSRAAHLCDLNEMAMDEITIQGTTYGVSLQRGRRERLEDAYRAIPDVGGDPHTGFFAVFDGHGGSHAAEYASEHLVNNIMHHFERTGGDMEAAVRNGFLETDAGFLDLHVSSGASALTAIVHAGCIWVAGAGDCRAVMSAGGSACALSTDHRPGRPDERERIESRGGSVDNCGPGMWRVQGILGVSRAIGDAHLKDWVIAEPEIFQRELSDDCEFLMLATDGLWDMVSNQEAVDLVRPYMCGAATESSCGASGFVFDKAAHDTSTPSTCGASASTCCMATPPGLLTPTPPLACHGDDEEVFAWGSSESECVQKCPHSPPPQHAGKEGECHWCHAGGAGSCCSHPWTPGMASAASGDAHVPFSPMEDASVCCLEPEEFLAYEARAESSSKGPDVAARRLVQLARDRGSVDDVCVMVIDLRCYANRADSGDKHEGGDSHKRSGACLLDRHVSDSCESLTQAKRPRPY
eukprot:jgi/Mesvir1/28082/Mv04673-RA.1